MDLGGWILTALTQLLYFLESCCYTLLDLAQLMFRLVAGLDTYSLAGSEIEGEVIGGIQLGGSGDIFYQIIRRTFIVGDDSYSVIAIAFWSLVILAALLLFISTIAAMIKSEVDVGKDGRLDNSKGKIIINSIKALLYFAIVPIACYFGIWLGNVVLFVVDSATSPQATSIISVDEDARQNLDAGETGSYNYYIFWGDARNTTYTSISGLVNKICLYSGNRIRNDDAFYQMIVSDVSQGNPSDGTDGGSDGGESGGESGETQPTPPVDGATYNFGIITQDTPEAAAAVVDDLFMFNAKLRTPQVLNSYDYLSAYGNASGSTVEYFDRSNISLVSYFYDLKSYNHILAILFIFTGGKVVLTLSFAAMHRIIMLLAMMFAEPITLSFMPLDKGEAFGKWRKSFISHVISLYVLVLVVNVFYIVAPIFQTFTFFSSTSSVLAWADMVVQTAFIIAALMAIQSFEKMFAGFLGGESIMEAGGKTMESLTKTAKTLGGVAMGAAKLGVGVAGLGMHAAGAIGHIGAAGIKAGLAAKNAAQVAINKGKMKRAEKKANMSDEDINSRAMKKSGLGKLDQEMDKVGAKAGSEYDDYSAKTHQAAMDEEYEKFVTNGGKMSREDWEEKTGDGSIYDAQARGLDYKGQMQYYKDHLKPGEEFDMNKFRSWRMASVGNWAKEDREALQKSGSSAAYANFKGDVKTLARFDGKSREEYVQENREQKHKEIMEKYNKEREALLKKREEAPGKVEEALEKLNKQRVKRNSYWDGAKKSATYTATKSGKGMVNDVGNMLGTLGGGQKK